MANEPLLRTPFGRRTLLAAGLTTAAGVLAGCAGTPPAPAPDPAGRLAALERRFGGRVGVAALDTGSGHRFAYRGGERFLMLSTVKVAIVAAVLRRGAAEPGLLDQRLHWSRADLLSYAPVTTRALGTGLTVAELCQAALTVSDNTAANLLSALVGGPPGVTAFLRSLGDTTSRADRTEPTLNDVAGDLDTTTPDTFLTSLRTITLGSALAPPQRDRLMGWMLANTTGTDQIRAGAPRGWTVADKTGSGSAAQANDVAVLRPPGRAPLLITVYTAPADLHNQSGHATIAALTRETLSAMAEST